MLNPHWDECATSFSPGSVAVMIKRCLHVFVCQGQVWIKQMAKPTPTRLVSLNYFQRSRCRRWLNTQLKTLLRALLCEGPLNNTRSNGEGRGSSYQHRYSSSNYLDVHLLIIIEDDRCPKQFEHKVPVSFGVWFPLLMVGDKDSRADVSSNKRLFSFSAELCCWFCLMSMLLLRCLLVVSHVSWG